METVKKLCESQLWQDRLTEKRSAKKELIANPVTSRLSVDVVMKERDLIGLAR